MLFRVLLVCVVLCVGIVQAGPYPCNWEAPDGSYFDLSSLTLSGRDYTFTNGSNSFGYKANICGLVQTDSLCSGKNGNFCFYNAQTGEFLSAVAREQPPAPTWILLDASNPDKGVRVTYSNGEPRGINKIVTPQVNIEFVCKSEQGQFQVPGYDATNIIYTAVFPTPAACPHRSSKGLSGGWIFIIIFLASTFLYVVIGCAVKYKKQGTRGLESCPNIQFWREVPPLVKEGCMFTYTRLRGCFGGSSTGVETFEKI